NAEHIARNYNTTFTQLHKQFKWTNKTVLMAAAAMYTMKSKAFDLETFKHTADSIKSEASLFSSMRSHPRFTTAAILAVNFDDPVKHIPRLFAIYKDLIQKFKRGNFTYIAATIILTNDELIQQEELGELVSRAKIIYDKMKKEHPFLTGQSDYPLATILAYENRDNIGQHMEYFYDKLNDNHFSKGNNLQFLSHILSLASSGENADIL